MACHLGGIRFSPSEIGGAPEDNCDGRWDGVDYLQRRITMTCLGKYIDGVTCSFGCWHNVLGIVQLHVCILHLYREQGVAVAVRLEPPAMFARVSNKFANIASD